MNIHGCRWFDGIRTVVMLIVLLSGRDAYAQEFQTVPVMSGGPTVNSDTNDFSGVTGSGKTNRVLERGAGSYSVIEGVGRTAEIRTNSSGSVVIRDTRYNNTTIVTPTENGGVVVRGPNNSRFVVSPQGVVQADKKRNKYINVTTSSDGKSVMIWGRGGIIYTIPISNNP